MSRLFFDPLATEVIAHARKKNVDSTEHAPRLLLANSQAKVFLTDLMRNYVSGSFRGCSVLVSGHRGVGKTTAINHAFLDVLSGPNGYRPMATETSLKDTPAADAPTVNRRPLLVYLPTAKLLSIDAEGGNPLADLGTLFLTSIVESLHQAIVAEFVQSLREQLEAWVEERSPGRTGISRPGVRETRGMRRRNELIAHFELDLASNLEATPARIGDYVDTIVQQQFLKVQSLLGLEHSPKQLALEKLVLSRICDANRRVGGTEELTELREAIRTAKATQSADVGLSKLLGFLTANVSRSSEQTDKDTTTKTFTTLRDAKSLVKELTGIFRSVKQVGLYPIIVVDELDKLDASTHEKRSVSVPLPQEPTAAIDTSHWLKTVTNQLKPFIQEHAMFCFVNDRSSYEEFSRAYRQNDIYTAGYSSYQFATSVFFKPNDLQRIAATRLNWGPTCVKAARRAKRLVLQSRAHPLELERRLSNVVELPSTIEKNAPQSEEELARIESILQSSVTKQFRDKVLTHMSKREPMLLRYAVDALYYVPRQLDSHEPIDVDLGFVAYLVDRVTSSSENTSKANQLRQWNDEKKGREQEKLHYERFEKYAVPDLIFRRKSAHSLAGVIVKGIALRIRVEHHLSRVNRNSLEHDIRQEWRQLLPDVHRELIRRAADNQLRELKRREVLTETPFGMRFSHTAAGQENVYIVVERFQQALNQLSHSGVLESPCHTEAFREMAKEEIDAISQHPEYDVKQYLTYNGEPYAGPHVGT